MRAGAGSSSPHKLLALAAILLAHAAAARATGMLVPEGTNLPPLAVKYHRVETTITDQAATTHVVQVFQNNVDQVLEATYLFPLPKGASIRDFSMLINGKRVQGELLERDKARGIYESIVRRLKDPGLLEFAGSDLIRARIYPIPARGTQQVELTYSEQLTFDGGIVRYLYPLKTGGGTLRTLDDLTFHVTVAANTAIKSVYSPTHKLDVARKDDRHASCSYEQKQGSLNDDFLLYYTVSSGDIGLNLVTYDGGRGDGYFMMMVAPKVEMPQGQILQKDVTFVVDTSGSMSADDKMRQAQNALKLCLKDLGAGDRFNIIRFSTEAEPFRQGLVAAGPAEVKDALAFVDGFRARGGTNIDEGLRMALQTRGDPKRPHIVMFMTDGIPTIGETDVARLMDLTRKRRGPETRIFAFGVGYDVNTKLLDGLSAENRGVTRYVRPEEDIEAVVGSLWTRISEPVMSHPEIRVDKTKVYDVYPKELPDLFASDQVVLYGRYAGNGASAIRLTGDIAGVRKELVFEGTFGAGSRNDANDFIPALWATRKVGYLLEEIRLRGENPELKDEVVRLSKEFGIMTPYTSFLVLPEDEMQGRQMMRDADALGNKGQQAPQPTAPGYRLDDERKRAGTAQPKPESDGRFAPPAPAGAAASTPAAEPQSRREARDMAAGMAKESGEESVKASQAIAKLKEGDKDASGAGVKRVGTRAFSYQNGTWIDTEYDGRAATFDIKYGSDAYFRVLALEPELARYLAIGPRVIVKYKGAWVKIGDAGREQIIDAEVKQAFAGK